MKITDKEAVVIGERLKECTNLSKLEWAQLIYSILSFLKFTVMDIGPYKGFP
jgi:hypothetical protein